MVEAFALFDTAIGRCSVAWRGERLCGIWLPSPDDTATRAAILRRHPGAHEEAPSALAREAIEGIARLLDGVPEDLSTIALDMTALAPFERQVYEVARTIAAGHTLTYGEIARALGSPGSARAVGRALGRNPFPIVVPCHRVLAAGGRSGGFSAPGGVATKLRLLAIERGDDLFAGL